MLEVLHINKEYLNAQRLERQCHRTENVLAGQIFTDF